MLTLRTLKQKLQAGKAGIRSRRKFNALAIRKQRRADAPVSPNTYRPLLSVLCATYVFIERFPSKRVQVWPSVAREFRIIERLLPFCFTDLRRPSSCVLMSSDSSGVGYAVSSSIAEVLDIDRLRAWRDKWRFHKMQGFSLRPRDSALGTRDPLSDPATVMPSHRSAPQS